MNDWQSMDTAPHDRVIELRLKDGMQIVASRTMVVGCNDEDCGAWMCETDDWPESWCDGICWHRNSYNKRSVQPVAWREAEQ